MVEHLCSGWLRERAAIDQVTQDQRQAQSGRLLFNNIPDVELEAPAKR
jgi:hypothetical protein